jgi:expansin (peptidoglycan-binding protein)
MVRTLTKKIKPQDLICALGRDAYVASNCGRQIKVTHTSSGDSVTVTLADACEGCQGDAIDLSTGAFQQLSDLGPGTFAAQWEYV